MLKELLDWAKKRLSPGEPPTREEAQDAAQEKRETRALSVTTLQAEVRHLQQEITDLTAVQSSGNENADRQVDQTKLALLEKQLEQKQQALSRLQGRI